MELDALSQHIVGHARLLAEQGEIRDAIELLYEIIDRYPEYDHGFELIGDYYLRNSQPELAMRPLEIALEINQENFMAHFLLGCAYGRMLRFDEALEELFIARELQPEDEEVLRNIGWVTCMAGDLETGRHYLLQALNMNPGNGLIYNDLAASYMFSNHRNLNRAKYWLEKATQIEPEEPFIKETYRAFMAMVHPKTQPNSLKSEA